MKRIICMFVSVVIIIGMVGCETKSNIKKEIDNGNYDKAVEDFNQSEDNDQETIDRFVDEMNQIYEEYNNGEIEYDDAKAKLKSLSQVNNTYIRETYTRVRGNIETLNDSKTSFMAAEEAYQQKEYEQAMKDYKAVISDDVNYSAAQVKIESIKGELVKAALKDAKEMADKDDYEGAIKELKQINKTAEDETVQKTLEEYNEAYVKEVVEQEEKLIEEKKLDEAKELLEHAILVVPDNSTLKNKLTGVEELQPVDLGDIHVLENSNDYEYVDEGITDAYGNDYSQACLFYAYWVSEEEYCLYYTAKQYKTLSGTIVLSEETHKDAEMYINIYADDKLVYSKRSINRLTKAIDFEAKVNNCDQLKIVVGNHQKYSAAGYLAIVNGRLSKQ